MEGCRSVAREHTENSRLEGTSSRNKCNITFRPGLFPPFPFRPLPPPRLHGRKYLVVNETDKFQRRPIPLDGLATPFHGQGNANLAPLKVEPSRCSPRIKAGTSKLCSGSQGADSLFFFFLSFFLFLPSPCYTIFSVNFLFFVLIFHWSARIDQSRSSVFVRSVG